MPQNLISPQFTQSLQNQNKQMLIAINYLVDKNRWGIASYLKRKQMDGIKAIIMKKEQIILIMQKRLIHQ